MKTFLLLFTMIMLTVFLISGSNAQMTNNTKGIGIQGALSFPRAPDYFYKEYNLGYDFGGHFRYNTTDKVAFEIGFVSHGFMLDDERMRGAIEGGASDVSIEGGDTKIAGFTGNVVLITNSNLRNLSTQDEGKSIIYLSAGVGIYNIRISDLKLSYNTYIRDPYPGDLYRVNITLMFKSENRFGINSGAGIENFVSPAVSIYLGVKAHVVFTENDPTAFFVLGAGLNIYR